METNHKTKTIITNPAPRVAPALPSLCPVGCPGARAINNCYYAWLAQASRCELLRQLTNLSNKFVFSVFYFLFVIVISLVFCVRVEQVVKR